MACATNPRISVGTCRTDRPTNLESIKSHLPKQTHDEQQRRCADHGHNQVANEAAGGNAAGVEQEPPNEPGDAAHHDVAEHAAAAADGPEDSGLSRISGKA